jgi:Ion channel
VLTQLAVATLMGSLIILVHLGGLTILVRVLRSRHPSWPTLRFAPVPSYLSCFLGLVAIHGVEIWLFAIFYVLVSALPDIDTALYFSIVTYASIGYGDVLLPNDWRIVGALEGVLGVILLGASTAFLVIVVAELKLFGHGRIIAVENEEAEPKKDRNP